jgi:hypothetical protein
MGLLPQKPAPPHPHPLLYLPCPAPSFLFTSALLSPQYCVCTSAHPDYIPPSSSSCFLRLFGAEDSNHPRQDLCGHHPKQQVSCFPNTKNSGSNWASKRTGLSAAPTEGRECKVSYRDPLSRSLSRAITLENAQREKEREPIQHREFVR